MKILDVINLKELAGVKQIKCTVLLKSSWNHSEFAGVIIKGEHIEDESSKLITVDQMKLICEGHSDIEFVNEKNINDVIFKYINNRMGFLINMNSNIKSEVISMETKKCHEITLSPTLEIKGEFSKGFRVSEDNKVVSSEYHTDYEIIKGLDAIIQSLRPSEYLGKISDTRKRAIETIETYKSNASIAESMKLFGE